MTFHSRCLLHLAIWLYTILHLLLAAWLPLAAHEAHYALYARDLQLSYLDHPPLAAWLQSMVLQVSSADFSLRLLPIGLSVLALYLLAHLARVIYPAASRWLEPVSVLILMGTLVFHGSMTLSPDVPLIALGLTVVLVTIRCLEQDRWRDWLLLGAAIGLAGLAKYTAVTLVVSVLAAVLLRRGWRPLFGPRLWLTGTVALLMISPVLWWNWQHDWATVQFHSDYQFEDIERWSGRDFLFSSASQVLYYSPLVVFGGAIALWRLLREARQVPQVVQQREFLIILFVVPVLLVYLAAALESRASPHWSMLGWILLIPILSHWLLDRWRAIRSLRVLVWCSAGYSVLILLVIVLLVIPLGRWPDFQHPIRLVMGWEAATGHGEVLVRALDPGDRTSEPVLLARNWHNAGLLAWYAPQTQIRNLFDDINPYNFRYGVADHDTWGVLVYPRTSNEPRLKDLTRDFNCEPIDALPAYFGNSLVQTFHYYACYSKIPPAGFQKASPTPK